jgi:hypothetical protein
VTAAVACGALLLVFAFWPKGSGERGVTVKDVIHRASDQSWEKTLAKSGIGPCQGAATALARLVLWHWLQPVVYWTALFVYWQDLNSPTTTFWGVHWQRDFGVAVGVREAIYVVGTLCALVLQPSFLLVDVKASWEEKWSLAVVYIAAPEKFVLRTCAEDQAMGDTAEFIFGGAIYLTWLLDLAALGALVSAWLSGVTPPALMLSYAVVLVACPAMAAATLKTCLCCPRSLATGVLAKGIFVVAALLTWLLDHAALGARVAAMWFRDWWLQPMHVPMARPADRVCSVVPCAVHAPLLSPGDVTAPSLHLHGLSRVSDIHLVYRDVAIR